MISKEKRIEMRKAIEKLILTECQSLNFYSKQIGITPHSLKGFLIEDRDTQPHVLGKIRNYLMERNILKDEHGND